MKLFLTHYKVKEILKVVDAGLVSGIGSPIPGQMCVEAAICYALGLPHSDDPQCVSQAVRTLKIALNDSQWSSPKARANGMRRLAIAQLGTNTNFDDVEFVSCVAIMCVNTILADNLRSIGLRKDADYCEKADTLEKAWSAADSAALSARDSAAWSAALSARDSARSAAETAWHVAENARSSSRSAARSAADSAAWSARSASETSPGGDIGAARDRVLSTFAEEVVQILIKMNVPATQYLPPLR